jgi:hypothetical protein
MHFAPLLPPTYACIIAQWMHYCPAPLQTGVWLWMDPVRLTTTLQIQSEPTNHL